MCGIVGWVDFEKNLSFSKNTMETMCDSLAKRGLQGHGLWLSENALLGHRSSIKYETVSKNQPLAKWVGENSYIIVMDGFLYNAHELKRCLEIKGHSFYSNLAHEIVLEAFIQWKEDVVNKLEGAYSFAIWDEKEQSIFICRDHCGVKPLFYYKNETSLIFGSEIKALLSHHEVKPKISKEGLSDILTISPYRVPGSGVFRDIYELLPGHYLKFSQDSFIIKQYWSLEAQPHEDSIDTTSEKIRCFLMNSVEKQLELFPNAGSFLSGGLNSSAVTSLICNYYNNNSVGSLHTFSVEYNDRDDFLSSGEYQFNTDAKWSKLASDFLHTEHSKISISTDNLTDSLKESMLARDLPAMGDIDSSLLLLCKNVKQYTNASFSGDCADEIFGNYVFKNKKKYKKDSFPWFANIDNKLSILSPEINALIKGKEHMRERYLKSVIKTPKLKGESKSESLRREIAFINFSFNMPNVLERCNRMASAAGLIMLLPFCDYKLIQYVYNIPGEINSVDDIERGILRRAMKGYIPNEILYRTKNPYPKAYTPSFTFAVKDILTGILNEPGSPLYALMDMGQLTILLDNPDINRSPSNGFMMGNTQLMAHLIQIDMWFKEYNVSIVG